MAFNFLINPGVVSNTNDNIEGGERSSLLNPKPRGGDEAPVRFDGSKAQRRFGLHSSDKKKFSRWTSAAGCCCAFIVLVAVIVLLSVWGTGGFVSQNPETDAGQNRNPALQFNATNNATFYRSAKPTPSPTSI